MLKTLHQQSWTCRNCLLRLKSGRFTQSNRAVSSAATSRTLEDPGLSNLSPTKKHDDKTLRLVFDSDPFWREFSRRKNGSSKRTGLLQNQYLTGPEGFRQFAHISLEKCQRIVAKVLKATTVDDYRAMARNLDRLSDLLCRVIDMADFMKINHPVPAIQEAAMEAFALIYEYMNVLNTTPGLQEQLKVALANPEVSSHWNEEEKAAVHVLLNDFAKSAIHLPPSERQRFVTLSSEISQLGPMFVNNMHPDVPQLALNKSEVTGLDPLIAKKLQKWSKVVIPMYGSAPRTALSSISDAETRRKIHVAYKTSSRDQIRRLELLLHKRAELAKLSGFPSYAHMTLGDKMAKTPEAVVNFLTSLNLSNRGQVNDELSKLLALKQIDDPSAVKLQPWDHSYYLQKYSVKHGHGAKARAQSLLPSFFSLGTVMQGLSRLFTHLYGVRLVPTETLPGETWNSDVRRLDVLDEDGHHIAVIYCDLFSRPGKSPNPAHFTLRGSREISQAEVAECATFPDSLHPNDGMAAAIRPGTNRLYQLPTIALLCDFDKPTSYGSEPAPALLSEHSVQTLFHEMGHAIHSVLGRTDLQSISGTRCAIDISELPSVLMESFATDPQVLRLYARHWQTGDALPEDMIRTMEINRRNRDNMHGAIDNESQILLSLLDQAYHSHPHSSSGIDTTAIYHDVYSEHSSLPDPPDSKTAWQGCFGHLFGYGATYYSYLFDRAIANKIWSDVFGKGKLSIDRNAGEIFKNEVLRWGGGRDGWHCVAGALGSSNPSNLDGKLAEGGEEAMREVGRWGLNKSAAGP
ncbi:Mitochondrial intermediate peptidase [Myotisia sp. PD_48]|nr:Mitochondrial intermediate peptidase [Myotisia sp. PD_48]